MCLFLSLNILIERTFDPCFSKNVLANVHYGLVGRLPQPNLTLHMVSNIQQNSPTHGLVGRLLLPNLTLHMGSNTQQIKRLTIPWVDGVLLGMSFTKCF
jgi:hypothetical protein